MLAHENFHLMIFQKRDILLRESFFPCEDMNRDARAGLLAYFHNALPQKVFRVKRLSAKKKNFFIKDGDLINDDIVENAKQNGKLIELVMNNKA